MKNIRQPQYWTRLVHRFYKILLDQPTTGIVCEFWLLILVRIAVRTHCLWEKIFFSFPIFLNFLSVKKIRENYSNSWYSKIFRFFRISPVFSWFLWIFLAFSDFLERFFFSKRQWFVPYRSSDNVDFIVQEMVRYSNIVFASITCPQSVDGYFPNENSPCSRAVRYWWRHWWYFILSKGSELWWMQNDWLENIQHSNEIFVIFFFLIKNRINSFTCYDRKRKNFV